jgi:hypothetical protein
LGLELVENRDACDFICDGEAAESDNHRERYYYSFHRLIKSPSTASCASVPAISVCE